jgi:hypothetical protein
MNIGGLKNAIILTEIKRHSHFDKLILLLFKKTIAFYCYNISFIVATLSTINVCGLKW